MGTRTVECVGLRLISDQCGRYPGLVTRESCDNGLTLPGIVGSDDESRVLASISQLVECRQIRGVACARAQQTVLRRTRAYQIVLVLDASLPRVGSFDDTD